MLRRAVWIGFTLGLLTGACTPKTNPGAVTGVIQLGQSDPQQNTLPAKPAVLYVMLRDGTPGATATAPIAVRKYLPPFQFPLQFSIGNHDALNPGAPLPEQLLLSARIALKGSATPVLPEDWSSGTPQPVRLGAAELKLTLQPLQK